MAVDALQVAEAILPFLAIGVSILSAVFNYNTEVRANRRGFAVVLAAITVVPLLAVYSDLVLLLDWPPLPFNMTLSLVYLAWAALSGPFYMTLCRRLFDAGLSKHLALIGLVPYLNYLLFIYLCLTPSRSEHADGET